MYSTRGIKPVGLGAAFVVNGLLITGLYLFIAPVIGPMIKDHTTIGEMIKEPPPPPPVPEDKPVTKPEVAREHPIVVPDPLIKTETTPNQVQTTTNIPDTGPPVELGKPEGTAEVTREPPTPPVPPLVAAQIDPRYAGSFQPEYPMAEIRLERDGKVSVRVLIGTDGRVKAVEDAGSTSPAFFEATRKQALSRWRFKPASRGGTPQESWKVMNVRFEMKNQ